MALTKPLLQPDQTASDITKVDLKDPFEQHQAHRLRLGAYITFVNADGEYVYRTKDGDTVYRPGIDDLPEWPDSVELKIRELAWRHAITTSRTGLDDWCDDITRLADDDVKTDEVEQLIINLGRADLVDDIELTQLHAQYLDERDG